MAAAGSGSRKIETKLRLPAPQSGPRLEQLGASQGHDGRWGPCATPLEEVVDEVEKPRVGVVEVLEDHDDRGRGGEPLEERAPGREELVVDRCRSRRRGAREGAARSSGARPRSGTCSASDRRDAASASCVSSSASSRPPRRADHLAERPERDAVAVRRASVPRATRSCSTRPSRYFRNSHARPGLADASRSDDRHESRCAVRASVVWKRSLSRRSSSSRPTKGASSVSARSRPPTLGDHAQRPARRGPVRPCP